MVCFEDDEDEVPVEYMDEEEETSESNVGRTWLIEFCLSALQVDISILFILYFI